MHPQDVSVLAILVATNGEEWLPDVIHALAGQTHPHLDVVAVDNLSNDRSASLIAKAFGGNAVTLDRRVGYGRALAAGLALAAEREFSPDAFLLVHDDAALAPDAVEALVEAMTADESIGVVGGKLVEWDDPEVLQEAGMTTDRYGRLFPRVERNELDQGQHDGMREVLFCTSASLLVRREVVERVGFFDLRYVVMRDDLDLCWRARLAGFRVVFTSAASARHAAAIVRGRREGAAGTAVRYFSDRNLIATVLKNYGAARLVAVLPVLLVQSLITAVLQGVRGGRGQARQVLGALQWNIVHMPSTIRARARARRRRTAGDGAVTQFMVHGSPRLRGYLERVLESIVGEPGEGIEEAEIGVGPPQGRVGRLRHTLRSRPALAVFGLLALVYLVGGRSLYGPGVLSGDVLFPFPAKEGDFLREYLSGWRSAGVAGAHPPSLSLLLLGVLSTICFGSTWLAARVLVLGLLPVGCLGLWRTAGKLGLGTAGRITASVVYALSPLSLMAFGRGLLPELVLLAAAPWLVRPLLSDIGTTPKPPGWRSLATTTAGLAVATSLSPWSIVFFPAAAGCVAIGVALARAGDPRAILRTGGVIAAGAAVLLLPWSTELIRDGTPLGIGGRGPRVEMLDLLGLAPGPSPVGVLGWALLPVALLGAALGRGRRRLVTVLLATGFFSLLAAWGAARGVATIAPRPGLPLVLTALSVAVLAAVAVEAIPTALGVRGFGLRHVAVGLAAAFLVVTVAVSCVWLARSRFDGLGRPEVVAPAFLQADTVTEGEFRVLWIGAPRPEEKAGRDAVRLDLTDPEGETMLGYGVRRSGPGERFVLEAATAILSGRADLGGRLLAPLGVRQIVARPDAPQSSIDALERQTDLRFRQSFQGSRVYDNVGWLPVAAPVAPGGWVRASRGSDPFTAILAVDDTGDPLRGLDRTGPARFSGPVDPTASTILLAQPFDPGWRLYVGDTVVRPHRAFGFATAFSMPGSEPKTAGASASPTPRATTSPAPAGTPSPTPTRTPSPITSVGSAVTIRWAGQGSTRALLVLQAVLWLVLGIGASRRAAFERGER